MRFLLFFLVVLPLGVKEHYPNNPVRVLVGYAAGS